jgi:hypothetical protein
MVINIIIATLLKTMISSALVFFNCCLLPCVAQTVLNYFVLKIKREEGSSSSLQLLSMVYSRIK